ncbi:MAG: hypothetical protein ABI970_21870, partial [Chloroflexota bacterium]
LKTTLARNLKARVYGDHGTPVYSNTGSDEVVVDVIFADNTHAEIYYYNTFLSSCQELKNGETPLFSTPIRGPIF